MFMSSIIILIFSIVKIVALSTPPEDKLTRTLKGTIPPGHSIPSEPNPSTRPDDSLTEPCRGENCRPTPNFIAPIVGSLCGILLVALIGVFIIWFYLRRKSLVKKDEVPVRPTVKFIEYPSLYTGTISTTDTQSPIYGMSPSRNDSITSHNYEQIHYNERS